MSESSGRVQGGVRWLLRLEGLAVLLLASALYARLDLGWGRFALWFFVPDLALLAYLANARIGAFCYNATHSYLGALALSGWAWYGSHTVLLGLGLIWCAHLGFDRALGYGLKYSFDFYVTHLGRIGRPKATIADSEYRVLPSKASH